MEREVMWRPRDESLIKSFVRETSGEKALRGMVLDGLVFSEVREVDRLT